MMMTNPSRMVEWAAPHLRRPVLQGQRFATRGNAVHGFIDDGVVRGRLGAREASVVRCLGWRGRGGQAAAADDRMRTVE